MPNVIKVDFKKKRKDADRKKRLAREIEAYMNAFPITQDDKIEAALREYGSFKERDDDYDDL